MSTDKIGKRKVITPKARLSFPHLFKAHSGFDGQEPKFSAVLLFPKSSNLKEIKEAIATALNEKWPDPKKRPANLRMPIRDGDEKLDLQGYKDHYFITASNKDKPGIVDQSLDAVMEPGEVYAGCFVRASLIAFAYDKGGNRGVSFSLQNLQKLADGPAFSGKKAAEDEFDAVDDGSDSEDNYDGDYAGGSMGS